jgi:protein-S-isoprenylcysteine O-methyltransferase Ste14
MPARATLVIGLRTIASVLILPGTAAVFVPWLILGQPAAPSGAAWLGLVPLALGLALGAWCVVLFAVRGRGTPAPWDPPPRFVAQGPYRVVRNPMYIGVALILAGEAILFRSWPLVIYLIAIGILWHLFVVAYEEPTLEQQFGDEYRTYRSRVPRWLPRP